MKYENPKPIITNLTQLREILKAHDYTLLLEPKKLPDDIQDLTLLFEATDKYLTLKEFLEDETKYKADYKALKNIIEYKYKNFWKDEA